MEQIKERLAKYFHSTLTVKSPVEVLSVNGNWQTLGRGVYEVRQLDTGDRKYVIRAYGDDIVVEEIELDSIVSGPEASIEDGAPGMADRSGGYITGPDDEEDKPKRKAPQKKSAPANKTTRKSPSKKAAPKRTPKKTTRKTKSKRKKKKESIMDAETVILERNTLINETIFPKGTEIVLHEIQDPAGQRTFGFGNEPDMVNDTWPDPEVAEAEDMMEAFVSKVTGVGGTYFLSEGTLTAELDRYLTYSDLPREREVAEAVGFEYHGTDWLEEVLADVDPAAYEMWMEQRDPEELFGIGQWLEKNGNDEWIDRGSDNTYNWGYLGPFDIDFNTVEYAGTFYTFYRVHLGGDIRGNYSDFYVSETYDETDFLYRLMGTAIVEFEFEDGSSWRFFSEQDVDVWHFDLDEFEIQRNSHAEQFLPLLQNFDNYDEAIEELWREVM